MPTTATNTVARAEQDGHCVHKAETQMSTTLDAKSAERDELLNWLKALEDEGASLEAVAIVRAQLERVLHDIAELKGLQVAGFSLPADAAR